MFTRCRLRGSWKQFAMTSSLCLTSSFFIKNYNHFLNEIKVFYLNMKGGYYCYFPEVASEKIKTGAEVMYKEAFEIRKDHMQPTCSFWFGLALNFSAFYYRYRMYYDRPTS